MKRMAIYRHATGLPPEARGAVVAIGNFDGVHRGHGTVLSEVGRLARESGTTGAVLTFEPHPRRFFRPDDPPFQLTSFRLKARLLESLGIDNLCILAFNRALSELSPEAFVRDILVRGLGARQVVVGANFAFGHRRRGNVEALGAIGRELGFAVHVVDHAGGPGGEAYSSTTIRDLLRAGDPAGAALALGRYWEIGGRVRAGARLGRELGFPTANIGLGHSLEPAYGVYAIRAGIDRGARTAWRDGVANVGVRPMVAGRDPLLEAHLFDTEGDLYGRRLRVALVEFLRPESTFDGLEAMREQMVEDARRARRILASKMRRKDSAGRRPNSLVLAPGPAP